MRQAPDILSFLSGKRFWLVVVLLWACAYLPGLGVRYLRLEEGRRATPARAMLDSGDFVTPRIYGEPYLNKPPGYFWIVAGVGAMLGKVNALATRLPSVVSVLISALIALRFAPKELSRTARGLAALMILSVVAMLDKGTLGEIDAFLSMLVFAGFAVFYNGWSAARAREAAGAPWRGGMFLAWVGLGLIAGAMVLVKGPGGVIELFVPVAGFVLWQKRGKELLSPGMLVCVVLMLLPTALWVWWLKSGGNYDLVGVWSHQVGARGTGSGVGTLLRRYVLDFPKDIIGMTLPWLIWGGLALVPKHARATGIPVPAWRFLVCAVVLLVVPFWLWPTGQGRYVLAAVYGVCLLAAAYLDGDAQRPQPARSRRMLIGASLILAAAPMACGVAAFGLALQYYRPAMTVASLLVVVGALGSAILATLVQRGIRRGAGIGVIFAAVLALAVISGRSLASAVLMPYKGESDEARLAVAKMHDLLPADGEVYTLESLSRSGEGGGAFYNIQFYVGEKLRAIRTAADLPVGRWVHVLGTAEHVAELTDCETSVAGTIPTKGRREVFEVVRVRRKGDGKASPPQ